MVTRLKALKTNRLRTALPRGAYRDHLGTEEREVELAPPWTLPSDVLLVAVDLHNFRRVNSNHLRLLFLLEDEK